MQSSQGKVNTKLIATIVIIVAVLAGVYWFLIKDNNSDDTKSTISTSQTNKANNLDYNGSLASLASAGKARKCTMKYSSPSGGTGTGTSYTDGKGQSRFSLVTTTSEGKQSTINTIVKDSKSYAWFVAGDQTYGYVSDVKAPQSSESNSQSSATTQPSGTVSPDQKFSMKCVSWSVDSSQFTVPTNINFITLPTSNQ